MPMLATEAVIEDLGLLPYIDAVLLSEEEGIEKPSREIFLRACSRVGVSMHEALHVGDELAAYVHVSLHCSYFC